MRNFAEICVFWVKSRSKFSFFPAKPPLCGTLPTVKTPGNQCNLIARKHHERAFLERPEGSKFRLIIPKTLEAHDGHQQAQQADGTGEYDAGDSGLQHERIFGEEEHGGHHGEYHSNNG